MHPYRGDLVVDAGRAGRVDYTAQGSSSSDGAANVDATYTRNLSSEAADGTWRLRVQDVFSQDTGTINSWTLTL